MRHEYVLRGAWELIRIVVKLPWEVEGKPCKNRRASLLASEAGW